MKRALVAIALLLVGGLIVWRVLSPSDSATNAQALGGTTWLATSIDGQAVPPGVWVTAKFEDKDIGGMDGCNSYGSDFALATDGSFQIGEVRGTAMGCSDPNGVTEDRYLDALGRARLLALSGDTLTLSDERHRGVVEYTASPEALLWNHAWSISLYRDGPITDNRAMTAPVEGTPMTIEFGNDAILRTSSPCATVEMSYRFADERLILGDPSPTAGWGICAPVSKRQQDALITDLASVWRWQVGMGGQFLLMTGSGTQAITLGPPVGST